MHPPGRDQRVGRGCWGAYKKSQLRGIARSRACGAPQNFPAPKGALPGVLQYLFMFPPSVSTQDSEKDTYEYFLGLQPRSGPTIHCSGIRPSHIAEVLATVHRSRVGGFQFWPVGAAFGRLCKQKFSKNHLPPFKRAIIFAHTSVGGIRKGPGLFGGIKH